MGHFSLLRLRPLMIFWPFSVGFDFGSEGEFDPTFVQNVTISLAAAPTKIYQLRFGLLSSQTRFILHPFNAVVAGVFHHPQLAGGGDIERPVDNFRTNSRSETCEAATKTSPRVEIFEVLFLMAGHLNVRSKVEMALFT